MTPPIRVPMSSPVKRVVRTATSQPFPEPGAVDVTSTTQIYSLYLPGFRRLRRLAERRTIGGLQSAAIFVILSFRAGPRGTETLTTSPRFLPSSAAPTGDSFDSLFAVGSASADPTI
jgi:hypothetical protein